MFRGSEQAKIDDKGRLKIPARFRQKLLDEYGPEVFVTILRDRRLTIYPIKVWEEKERQLESIPDSLKEKEQILLAANFFGTEKTVDDQGRLPIPPHIREKAGLDGEVTVMGRLRTLVVMNQKYVDEWLSDNFPTAEVHDRLREYGH